jgi:2,4-dienoyl-CoA reductase-like NADH-dependent reductase (Old Yellow Enzyme family)
VREGKADMIALGRGFLDQPHWAWAAARAIGTDVERPPQYLRSGPKLWQAIKPA